MIQYEGDKERIYSTAGRGEPFAEVLARRISRRGVLKSGAAAGALAITGPVLLRGTAAQDAATAPSFESIPHDTGDAMTIAAGHTVIPFLRWGDPITADAPAFDPLNQSAAAQEKQFGYNCDWIGFLPLPFGSRSSDHGLLVVNHEYTNPEIMFPGYLVPNPEFQGQEDVPEFIPSTNKAIVDVELAAHGLSIVEIKRGEDGTWQVVKDSPYNRRITATTPMLLSGPAAEHSWMATSADPTGTQVTGTLNNCAGGITPWGTIVSGEENFHQYFGNLDAVPDDNPAKMVHARYGLPGGASERLWETVYDRFDLTQEPHEPFRFGWGVEIDPYDPTSTPKKRTALGRTKHEGHTSVIAPGGQVVVYSGDDERFEYVYKFVTKGTFNPDDRAANMDLLDEGTLYVARFNDDGTGDWLPLVFGEGPLTADNGFASQAEVLINCRGAADLLGATKMDRPEDIETNPVNKKVYMVFTNNSRRGPEGKADVDAANPRSPNPHGHIIEVTEANDDHAATSFTWEIFMLCGDPADESTYFAGYPKEKVSSISSPDNITFDLDGNLWISSDGQPYTLGVNDGLYVVPVAGPERGHLKLFFTAVVAAEVSGPEFTPDNTALFASIQHPGEGGRWEEQISVWPDGAAPPRPSVVLVTADNGGRVGV